MANHRSNGEKGLAKVANYVYSQIKGSDRKLYRGFRVYHPVYRISVDIHTEQADDNYHIIEKYMDKLICGYTGDEKMVAGPIIIRDKDELFELLGIDQQAYEIAEYFFQDLMRAGHFKVIPGVGIQSLKPAYDSVKLNKKVSSVTVREKRLFDQFSGEIMPKVFEEELERFAQEQDVFGTEYSIGLNPRSLSASEVNYLISNYDYINTRQIDHNLPRGFQSLSVSTETPIDIVFYPYYLLIFKTGNRFEYEAYRVDNGKPIEWIGEQYKTAAYSDAVKRLAGLSVRRAKQVFLPPASLQYQMTDHLEPLADNGFSMDPDTGNYMWSLQDNQIEDMLGLGNDGTYKPVVTWIAESDLFTISKDEEAGRFVFIQKTAEQKELLLNAAAAKSAEERKRLFDDYL